jgi:hypothetical protein
MMKSSGLSLQALGVKYKDDAMMSQGKDLEVLGEKYVKENMMPSESGSMGAMH